MLIDDHDGEEVRLKKLSIPKLRLTPLFFSSLGAALLDPCTLDALTNEDRDCVHHDEVDQIASGVTIGKEKIWQPKQRRPDCGRSGASQPIAQRGVQHREKQQSNRAASRESS
ncbi:MAG TPA: hypothetical protein VND88_03185 [Candidatus Acidoferrales bacterium]|nr:hypothetical protein [Candidatus Acidoferrales bacterium]